MASTPATAQMVLFGGFTGSINYLGDTWTYDGTTWSQQSPATSPSARGGASMAYDPATGQMVLFGGVTTAACSPTPGRTSRFRPASLAPRPVSQPLPATPRSTPVDRAIVGRRECHHRLRRLPRDGPGGEGTTPINSAPITGTTYMATGLSNGTTYYFTVKAINAIGHSTASNEASATPVTVPGAPTSVSATAGNTQVQLLWTTPSSDGGSAITGYDVYQGTSPGGEGTTPINSAPITGTTYMATGLSNGTTYYFTVKAINTIGHSTASNEASATPVTVPGAPSGLTATAHPGNIALAWTAPTNTGGSAIENYQVFRGTTSGGEGTTPLATVTAATYTDTSSTPGVTYYYTVEPHNAQGNSVPSVEAHALISTTLAGGPHLAATPDGTGYWVVGPTGAVTAYGTAHDHGSEVGKPLNGPIVGIAATPDGQGYWLVGHRRRGVHLWGRRILSAPKAATSLNQPVVGIATTADGQGYLAGGPQTAACSPSAMPPSTAPWAASP